MKMSTEDKAIERKKSVFSRLWNKMFSPKAPMPSRKAMPFNRYDWIAMIGISLFYALFAFSNLGDRFAPQTSETILKNDPIELSASGDAYISTICWCLWDEPDLQFKLEIKPELDSEWIVVDQMETKSVFGCWNGFLLPCPAKQVRITHETADVSIREMVMLDLEGYVIQQTDTSVYPALYDEPESIPNEITYKSSYYFDEMLYALTAYEFLNGIPAFEITHPPFGKILIALGVLLFGYTPFGIRFVGALLGVLMLPCLYLLARNITRNRGVSTFIIFLFAFDFMHFTQTRVTTIDVYITFFIIIMYYFMERYLNLSFYDTSLIKTWIPLGCCGIAFGFGIASKWTGFYAGAGLAILFFIRVMGYYREYRYALMQPDEVTNDISHRCILNSFKKKTLKTIIFCLFFYVAIPFLIYLLSYIPFVDGENQGLISRMIENQKFMLNYHSNVDFPNDYTSRWYEWPFMIRPMRYYTINMGGIARQGINAFGNPMVWWAGIPAFVYTLYLAIRKKKAEAYFLCVSYLAQYLPWAFISRPTFIYHYFTSVPFVTLMIGYCFAQIRDKVIEKKILDEKSFYCVLIIYAAAAYGLFQLFLPILSGDTISFFYVEDYLNWFKSWDFVIR